VGGAVGVGAAAAIVLPLMSHSEKIETPNSAPPQDAPKVIAINTSREALECIQQRQGGIILTPYYFNKCAQSLVVEVCETKKGIRQSAQCRMAIFPPESLVAAETGFGDPSEAPTDSIGFRACIVPQRISIEADGRYICFTPQ